MKIKAVNVLSIGASTASAITKDDVIFIISVLIIVLQAVMAYLGKKKESKEDE